MVTATEATGARNQYGSVLSAGLTTLSLNQVITFTRYVRVVLPLDGSAFWVRADLLSPSALLNATAFNTTPFSAAQKILTPAPTEQVQGSLHYSTIQNQDENEGFSINRVVFTSKTEVEALNAIAPNTLFIGEFDGLRFAFSRRSMLYRQAEVYHYEGDAVYPALATQLIDSVDQLASRDVVVSNSLPVWLSLNALCPMYPSYLIPEDIDPPWCSVHIPPEQTGPLQAVPYLDPTQSHYQLTRDRVKLTTYGLRNYNIMDLLDYVMAQFENDSFALGLMSLGSWRDEKRTQTELNVLAQKKTIEFEVSYYQARVRDIAQQFLLSCIPTFYIAN